MLYDSLGVKGLLACSDDLGLFVHNWATNGYFKLSFFFMSPMSESAKWKGMLCMAE